MEILYSLGSIAWSLVKILFSVIICLCAFAVDSCSAIYHAINEKQEQPQIVSQRQSKYSERLNQSEIHEELINLTRQKSDVDISHLHHALDEAGIITVAAYKSIMGDNYVPVITSGNDSHEHTHNSKHYRDAALDFRLNDISSARDRERIYQTVKEDLGNDFVVLHESKGSQNEHIHVQLK